MELQAIGEGGRGEQVIPSPFPTDQLQLQMNQMTPPIHATSAIWNTYLLSSLAAISVEKTPLHISSVLGCSHRRAEAWRRPLFPTDIS